MLKHFSIFNLDSFYSQVDFQTPATPISESIIHSHHDLMFILTFIVFFVFWMIFRTFQLHAYPNEKTLVLTRALIKLFPMGPRIHSRNFSTIPNRDNSKTCFKNLRTQTKRTFNTFERFKNLKKTTMINFVKNKHKQQETFLFIYITSILLIILYMLDFNIEAFGATFCLLTVFLFIYILGYFLVNLINSLPNIYKSISLLCFSLSFLYLGYFIYALVLIIMSFRAFFNTKPTNTKPYEPYKETDTSFQQFLKGFSIIDYHYKVDFYYFNHLRYFTGILTIFYIKALHLKHKPLLLFTFFWTEESCKLAIEMVSFIFVFNLFVLVFIQFTIINYCNPVITGPFAHKVLVTMTATGAVAAGVGTMHEALLNTETDPVRVPGRALYQYYTCGYACDSAKGLKAAGEYKYRFGRLPPLLEDGMTLDVQTTREELETDDEKKLIRQAEIMGKGATAGISTGMGYGIAKGLTKGAITGIKESVPLYSTYEWIVGSDSTPLKKIKK